MILKIMFVLLDLSPPRRGAQDQCCPVTVATAPGVGGGTVLVVSLPPPGVRPPPPPHQSQVAVYSPTYIEVIFILKPIFH